MVDALAPSIAPPESARMNVKLFNDTRIAKGLSIEACASRIRVGRNTPRRWMNGEVVPMLDAAQRLASLLGLTVNDLWPVAEVEK